MSTVATDAPFDIATHNGIVTIKSIATGEHRTLRIRTQKEDSSFLPGRRIVSLLTGSDNESSYTSFGMLSQGGTTVFLWKRLQDSKAYNWYKRFLENPGRFEDKVEINFEGRCRRCNRLLTVPESVESGIGPTCAGR